MNILFSIPRTILPILIGASLLAAPQARSAILISNFEPTDPATYVPGSPFKDVDGWTQSGAGTGTNVTPSGYTFVISGTQSGRISSVLANGTARKLFNTVGGITANDIYELSWLQASPDQVAAGGEHGVYLANASGSTPVGIYAKNTTAGNSNTLSIHVSGTSIIDTEIDYFTGGGGVPTLNNIYRFIMRFDFDNFQMTAFYEDMTNDPGNRQFLATVGFNSTILPSAAVVAADFGPALWSTSGVVGFDDIYLMPIPEPGAAALLLIGLAGFSLRRVFLAWPALRWRGKTA